MMKKSAVIFVGAIIIQSLSGAFAYAEDKAEMTLVDSVTVDKTGNLRYSYSVPGGCEKHEGRVEFELKTEQSENMVLYVKSAKVRIFDVTPKTDECKSVVRVEGTIQLEKRLQQAADLENAIIDDVRLPISFPQVNVFTGK